MEHFQVGVHLFLTEVVPNDEVLQYGLGIIADDSPHIAVHRFVVDRLELLLEIAPSIDGIRSEHGRNALSAWPHHSRVAQTNVRKPEQVRMIQRSHVPDTVSETGSPHQGVLVSLLPQGFDKKRENELGFVRINFSRLTASAQVSAAGSLRCFGSLAV